MCVAGLQKLVHEVEDIGYSVSNHSDAIERSASKFMGVGRDLDMLRSGIADVNVKVESVFEGFQVK